MNPADKLGQTEERFRLALEAVAEGVWDWNLETGEFFFSDALVEMLGYSRNEAPSQISFLKNWLHPDDRVQVIQQIQNLRSSPRPYQSQYRLRTKDGRWKWILDRGRVVQWDAAGRPLRAIGLHIDISEQKASEALIHLREERLRLATDAAHLGIWDSDLRNQTCFWNARMFEIHDVIAGQSTDAQRDWENYVHPGDAERSRRTVLEALHAQRSFSLIYRMLTPAGELKWLRVMGYVYRDSDGIPTRLVGFILDITTTHQMELALESSQNDLRMVEGLAAMGSWSWDCLCDEVIWSEGLYALFGMDPAESLPNFKEHLRLYTPESWEKLRQSVENCLQTGDPYHLELEAIRSSGGHFFLAARGMAARDELGKIARLYGTVHEITDQKIA
ncbi:MAG TPA: PAS domain-containing protein, partial [Chthoniobacterales bacterium]